MMHTENTAGKQRGKPFAPGQSGNPSGKPKGARNRATLAVQALLDGEAETIARKAIELALAGDITALRLCLERILPPRREQPVPCDLPPMKTPADASVALSAIVATVSRGELTPGEGGTLSSMVETYRRALETLELEKRIIQLEEHYGKTAR